MLTMQTFGSGSPDPMYAPRRLSVDTSVAGEDGLISTVLPQDLVVSILADRLHVRTHLSLSRFISNPVFFKNKVVEIFNCL